MGNFRWPTLLLDLSSSRLHRRDSRRRHFLEFSRQERSRRLAIVLGVAEAITEVQVRLSQTQVAEEEIKLEEKQRVLGVLPNFYVSYIPNAAPLDAKQKFKLALRTVVDPFTFVFVGAAAGVEQAEDAF